jgi:hypothetical protein
MPRPLPPAIATVLDEDQSSFNVSTLRVYRSAWRDILGWVEAHTDLLDDLSYFNERRFDESSREESDERDLPRHVLADIFGPSIVAAYLEDRADLAWSTLTSRRQALRFVAEELGHRDPFDDSTVDRVWSRIRKRKREEEGASTAKERPETREYSAAEIIERGPELLAEHLGRDAGEESDLRYYPRNDAWAGDLSPDQKALLPAARFEKQALRNRALLLLVATGELTRSELTRLDVDDVYPPDGPGDPLRLLVYDREGEVAFVLNLHRHDDVQHCPKRALAAWILAADLTSGPLFQSFTPHGKVSGARVSPQTVNYVIKQCAEAAGLDPKEWSTRRLKS